LKIIVLTSPGSSKVQLFGGGTVGVMLGTAEVVGDVVGAMTVGFAEVALVAIVVGAVMVGTAEVALVANVIDAAMVGTAEVALVANVVMVGTAEDVLLADVVGTASGRITVGTGGRVVGDGETGIATVGSMAGYMVWPKLVSGGTVIDLLAIIRQQGV
jgi:hypothetical protein